MRRRFRNFVRSGWHVVEVPRANLYKWNDPNYYQTVERNRQHYLELREWCNKVFKKDTWEATCHSDHGTNKPGIKKFAFKHERDRTMFILKWL